MADPKFHSRKGPLTLDAIARISGAVIKDTHSSLSAMMIEDVAALSQAGPKDISFLDNRKYKDEFQVSKAGACFIRPEFESFAPAGMIALMTPTPYKAYALAAQAFYPAEAPGEGAGGVAPSAVIHTSVGMGDGCTIGHHVVIEEGVKLGRNVWIEHGAVIGRNVEIGDYSRIGAQAVVSHALIGAHVRLYPGVCIGQDGFGFAIDPAGYIKVPQLGRVIIEDHVEIGANTTIDRGAGPDTVIGKGTWIDNLVQIGHNVKIGKGCIIVAQVGISGSTVIEDYVAIGGQAGIAGHLKIGKGARIAAQSGVMRDIPAGEEHMGSPSVPIKQYMRQVASLAKLTKREKTS